MEKTYTLTKDIEDPFIWIISDGQYCVRFTEGQYLRTKSPYRKDGRLLQPEEARAVSDEMGHYINSTNPDLYLMPSMRRK